MALQPNIRLWPAGRSGALRSGPGPASDKSQAKWIGISRPRLPSADELLPYIRHIDASRFYTNGGPLQQQLLEGLAAHFRTGTDVIGLAGSGTAAIVGLLLGAGGRAGTARPLCLCPAYTFVATACAAEICGYAPYLADVDPQTWALDPAAVEALPRFAEVGAVIVVAPYGRPVDLVSWAAFARRTGRIVVVDAAASFDTIPVSEVMTTGLPVAISLHATKTLSTAEGGLMLCSDPRLMRRALAAVNFGFDGARTSILPGTNGKISEYHVAVGLAELDTWTHKRAAFIMTATIYSMLAEMAGIVDRILVNTRQAVPYALFLARDAEEARRAGAAMTARHIEFRRWYGDGLQAHPAYRSSLREPLPVTDDVALRVIGLPFSVDLSARDIDRVIETLATIAGSAGRPSGGILADRRLA